MTRTETPKWDKDISPFDWVIDALRGSGRIINDELLVKLNDSVYRACVCEARRMSVPNSQPIAAFDAIEVPVDGKVVTVCIDMTSHRSHVVQDGTITYIE